MTDSKESLIALMEAKWRKENEVYKASPSSYNEGWVDGYEEAIQDVEESHKAQQREISVLLPCPFCGEAPELIMKKGVEVLGGIGKNKEVLFRYIKCEQCDFGGSYTWWQDRATREPVIGHDGLTWWGEDQPDELASLLYKYKNIYAGDPAILKAA